MVCCGPHRTHGNYRVYGERDIERLRQICVYRDAGLALADIRAVLDAEPSDASAVLRRRMVELSVGIERLREHQRCIARLIQGLTTGLPTRLPKGLLKGAGQFRKDDMVSKEKWTAIMSAAGFTEDDMRRWHCEFEKSAPGEHQEFLEFLHIPAEEIKTIRTWSAAEAP